MLVRTHDEIPKVYIYGAGGGVALLIGGILYLKALMVTVPIEACSARFNTGVRFGYAKASGELLNSADLEGRLGGNDWGLHNVTVMHSDLPDKVAVLDIALDHEAKEDDGTPSRAGMGFNWESKVLRNVASACLGYSVWVPRDFSYGNGGVLPGLFGDVAVERLRAEQKLPQFSTRLRWRPDGTLEIVPITNGGPRGGEAIPLDQGRTKLELGTWMHIEQEVELNTVNERDGILRVWVNGKLQLDKNDVVYRANDVQRMLGVNADVHFVEHDFEWGPPPHNTRIRLSPLELRVK